MVPSAATTGELKMPSPVGKLHCAPPVLRACTVLSPVCAALPRNLGHGLPGSKGADGPDAACEDEHAAATSGASKRRQRGRRGMAEFNHGPAPGATRFPSLPVAERVATPLGAGRRGAHDRALDAPGDDLADNEERGRLEARLAHALGEVASVPTTTRSSGSVARDTTAAGVSGARAGRDERRARRLDAAEPHVEDERAVARAASPANAVAVAASPRSVRRGERHARRRTRGA